MSLFAVMLMFMIPGTEARRHTAVPSASLPAHILTALPESRSAPAASHRLKAMEKL